MLRAVKQVRAAVSLLNPDEVRDLAQRRVTIGLVAKSPDDYEHMERALMPLSSGLYRASDEFAPRRPDLVFYHSDLECPNGAFSFDPGAPDETVAQVLRAHDELGLPLARHFLSFRRQAVERIVHAISRENALFAVTTALPDVIPNLIELPWAIGEFASDTAFLTINQVRMAFMVAGACGAQVGYAHQKAEVLSIGCGALGWRAIARELVGKIPLGGGLIPKGAIAYAGTFVIGKGLERYYRARTTYSPAEREEIYQQALERGRTIVRSLAK
ncbi:MAG TPA: hypothetical protein VG675_05675 [Bryobacteraceae bacterium]|nr:hypothetical protein [Bryobacteraceae bacterium]